MARRPQHLDITGANASAGSSGRLTPRNPNFFMDLPSPRVGEVPPALSPLDAFALHSRALAKRLEESAKNGRRMSRLPHHEIQTELAKRPGYFRSMSGESDIYSDDAEDADEEDEPERQTPHLHISPKEDRPVSQHPSLGHVRNDDDRPISIAEKRAPRPPQLGEKEGHGYFGIQVPRSSSPEPFDPQVIKIPGGVSPGLPSLTSSIDSIQSSQPRTLTGESSSSRQNQIGLAPPRSPLHPRSVRSIASIRSVIDSAEEDNASVAGSEGVRVPNNNAASGPHSPLSPEMHPASRSPSAMSEYSVNDPLPRPSFNFSRPRSSSGLKLAVDRRPSFDSRTVDRKASNGSSLRDALSTDQTDGDALSKTETRSTQAPSRQNSDYDAEKASSMSEADIFSGDESVNGEHSMMRDSRNNGAPSYIYSKYSLPRGRAVERNSAEARKSWMNRQFKWEELAPEQSPARSVNPEMLLGPQTDTPPPSLPSTPSGHKEFGGSISRSRSAEPTSLADMRSQHKSVPSSPSVVSTSTDRTIRGRVHVRNSPSQEIAGLSPEEHLEKGIEAHNAGSLSKSTYHLRLAAKAGLPTAMLLYALACRHGWGMRANQAEGVAWLKRAVDSSGFEFATDPDADPLSTAGPDNKAGPMTPEQRSRKAQFALAIYELGMSYMNGWGIPRDRSLAVRCFEIAGSWGDNDALAEAGFCYTQGVGCKKDLKKAAAFYRRAAEGGMSMAGNSWIYKPKYMDDPIPSNTTVPPTPPSDKTSRAQRPRGKSFFSRKRPQIAP